ncbi:LuxR C-terminal-related transcriptional regulator [Nocardioides nitrophenolicus]|uniref:LuxR C-terminal-related transcriptional regulator n=1 Tax=Nocardioides nitrophenolicus TaxID=60489 RepID=UPI0019621C98|nr:response regulator transcription factor [Nocardioides nitrophenolicus]
MPGPTRIVLVEDHALFAQSLDFALTREGHDVRVLTPDDYPSPAALLTRVRDLHPRIVLVDLDLGPLGDGRLLIGPLARAGVLVLVLTATTDRARWGECLALGARQVLSKSGTLDSVLGAIRVLLVGGTLLREDERAALVTLARETGQENREIRARFELLTPREATVLGCLMRGQTVHDVATAFVVSESTVRTQVKRVLAKLDVSSQLEAVGLANRVGWHPPAA